MAITDYHFITEWRVPATIEEVAAIITDGQNLARWWPAVYLDVQELAPGDERGIGKVVALHTKGWLPYTLRWQFRVSEVRSDGFTLEAEGDFNGRGIWTFAQDGPDAVITYDWKIRVDKPLLRYLSFALKPIFAANHRWAMAQGEQSLRLELARRRAASEEERARIAPPPSSPTTAVLQLLIGVGIAAILAYLLVRRADSGGRYRNSY